MLHIGGQATRGQRLRGRTLHRALLGLGLMAVIASGCAANPDGSDPGSPPVVPESVPVTTVDTPPTTAAPAPGGGGTATTFRSATAPPSVGDCTLHPQDHFLNATNIDTLAVHPRSAAWLASIGGDSATLKFPTSRIWESARSGMPVNVVDSRIIGFTEVALNPWGSSRSYRGPYPIPPSPQVQGHPSAQWDKHLLIIDVADCSAYELIQYDPVLAKLTGIHSALSGAHYPLDTTDYPYLTTNAPQTPMIGQYVMRSEVDAGDVSHAIGFCSDRISTEHQWPARRSDGKVSSPDAMPMGTWIRLRADASTKGFGPGASTVARALREHGAILTDTCSHPFHLMAENSGEWNDDDLQALRSLSADDFEVVDTRAMQAAAGSHRIR